MTAPSRTAFRWLWVAFYVVLAGTTNVASGKHQADQSYWLGMAMFMLPIAVALLFAQRRKLGFWNPLRVFRSS